MPGRGSGDVGVGPARRPRRGRRQGQPRRLRRRPGGGRTRRSSRRRPTRTPRGSWRSGRCSLRATGPRRCRSSRRPRREGGGHPGDDRQRDARVREVDVTVSQVGGSCRRPPGTRAGRRAARTRPPLSAIACLPGRPNAMPVGEGSRGLQSQRGSSPSPASRASASDSSTTAGASSRVNGRRRRRRSIQRGTRSRMRAATATSSAVPANIHHASSAVVS